MAQRAFLLSPPESLSVPVVRVQTGVQPQHTVSWPGQGCPIVYCFRAAGIIRWAYGVSPHMTHGPPLCGSELGGVERRGRDSNPEAREGAGFRDRCIAVLPPLRGVLHYRAASRGGKRLVPLVRALSLYSLGGERTGWDSASSRVSGETLLQPCCKSTGENPTFHPLRFQESGRGGIRTHVTLLMSTHFPGVRLQPLGHPSSIVCL